MHYFLAEGFALAFCATALAGVRFEDEAGVFEAALAAGFVALLFATALFATVVFVDVADGALPLSALLFAAVGCAVLDDAALERTWVTGARCTDSETSSVRCTAIALEVRWFQRLRSDTETLKRSATVTNVSPERVT